MFLPEKAPGEVHSEPHRETCTQPMKLSEAIRRGKPLIRRESIASFQLCALGCAWAGVRGHQVTDQEIYRLAHPNGAGTSMVGSVPEQMARELGFDPEICRQVHDLHIGGMRAAQIADWLEWQGL